MSHIRGLVVRLKTENRSWAGTDDHIYLGIVGKGGGREFPLDVNGFDDFEEGTDIKYWLGTVWDGAALTGAKKPNQSQPDSGRWNDPAVDNINLNQVDYVYLRKGGTRQSDNDDAYMMDEVEATLYGSSPNKRTFRSTVDIGLANEYGLQVWLQETAVG